MENYLYALSKKPAFFHPCFPETGLAEHRVPPFQDRASDSNVGCDSGCTCYEQVLVRKLSGAAVVLQVLSWINRNMDLGDPSHPEIASWGRHTFAGLCNHSCETSS